MRIAIAVICTSADLIKFFNKRRGSVVPQELRGKGREFNVICLDHTCSKEDLLARLADIGTRHDCVGILSEACLHDILPTESGAIFTKRFDANQAQDNPHNYFGHFLVRWLKNLIFLYSCFQKRGMLKCLMLPLKNFDGADLKELSETIAAKSDQGSFSRDVEGKLKMLHSRCVPKKRNKYKTQYIKDDSGLHFQLGYEKHGQAEVQSPPHTTECSLTAIARFGVTMDRELHFNVSRGQQHIEGVFNGCHGDPQSVGACSHINMFPNGQIR